MGRRGINLRPRSCQDFQADLPLIEVSMSPLNVSGHGPADQTDDQGVARLQRFHTRGPAGAIIFMPDARSSYTRRVRPHLHERIPLGSRPGTRHF
jgi:hypothetical protein